MLTILTLTEIDKSVAVSCSYSNDNLVKPQILTGQLNKNAINGKRIIICIDILIKTQRNTVILRLKCQTLVCMANSVIARQRKAVIPMAMKMAQTSK